MADTTPRAEGASRWDIVRAAWIEDVATSETARLSTIQSLGFIALAGGALIAVTGPVNIAPYTTFDTVWGWPVVWGLLLAAFGCIQLWGCFRTRPLLAVYGSALAMLWYAAFGGGFITSWLRWVLHEPHLGEMPVIYPVAMYFGLATIHAVQSLITFRKVRDRELAERLLAGGNRG